MITYSTRNRVYVQQTAKRASGEIAETNLPCGVWGDSTNKQQCVPAIAGEALRERRYIPVPCLPLRLYENLGMRVFEKGFSRAVLPLKLLMMLYVHYTCLYVYLMLHRSTYKGRARTYKDVITSL